MTRGIAGVLLVTSALAAGAPVSAHHSFAAQYDSTRPVTLQGAVTRVEWMNPHVYFYLDVTDAGGKPVSLGDRRRRAQYALSQRLAEGLAEGRGRGDGAGLPGARRHQPGQHALSHAPRRPQRARRPERWRTGREAAAGTVAMTGHRVALPAALILACALLVLLVPGRPRAQGAAARPDLSGFWINQYTPDLSVALGTQPPFTAHGAERWRTVDTSKDPTGFCLPAARRAASPRRFRFSSPSTATRSPSSSNTSPSGG